MIPRYSRPEMSRLWEPENRYRAWLLVEILACEASAGNVCCASRQSGRHMNAAKTKAIRKRLPRNKKTLPGSNRFVVTSEFRIILPSMLSLYVACWWR